MVTRTPLQRSRRARPHRSRALIAVAAGVAVLVVGVVGAVLASGGDDESAPAPASDELGIAHVHGLGVNPADGSIFVATHNGTFRLVSEGPAERVGDSYQDTMGFTVVGPDHFLGSGHPDTAGMQEGLPGLLGLIESTDAGVSWEPVSLLGEVDFHALAYAHDKVYGWDATSGRFLMSADRRTWDERSTVDLHGFAVDPDDPDHIVGGGPSGLVESHDGARTWAPSQGPGLVVMSWDPDAGLWGADAAGAVWRRDAGGWAQAGELPGPPQAFLATSDGLYAAAGEHDTDRAGIYASDDAGRTWDLRYRDPEA